MMFAPLQLRPVRHRPLNFRPDDGRSYRIYKRLTKDGADTLIATLEPGVKSYTFTGTPNSEAWIYARAVNRCGIEDTEPVGPKLKRVAFDAAGNLILPVPNAPTGLALELDAGGQVTASWLYQSFREGAAPSQFNVYRSLNGDPIDYDAAPFAQVAASGARRYTADLGTHAHGTLVSVAVRAQAASGAEESNLVVASAVADDQAPTAPTALTVEIETE